MLVACGGCLQQLDRTAESLDHFHSARRLLLEAKSAEGPGIFARVTYIQRVNTTGGTAPTEGCDAAHAGQEVRVPYTADYFFYRAKGKN